MPYFFLDECGDYHEVDYIDFNEFKISTRYKGRYWHMDFADWYNGMIFISLY